MKILITGDLGKIGSSLKTYFNAEGFNRNTSFQSLATRYDVIIHCAANTQNFQITGNEFYNYISDNIFLTDKLLQVPSTKFVYLSTTAVYPPSLDDKSENANFDVNDIRDVYGITKFTSEVIVQKIHSNYLILRPVHVLVNSSNLPQSIKNIQEHVKTTLCQSTYYNFISVQRLIEIINIFIHSTRLQNEIINVASDVSCSITEIATYLNKDTQYGNYTIYTHNIPTTKLKKLCPEIQIPSSMDCFKHIRQI